MYLLASFLAFLALAYAQRPAPCETPKEWTGRMLQVDRDKDFAILGKTSYDAINKRVRVVEEVDFKGNKTFYDYIILYNVGRLYRIKLSINKTGECTVYEIREPFRPAQVPSDAKFGVEAYLGGSIPETGVLVNTFYGKMKASEETVDYIITVTTEGCVPVSSIFYSKKIGGIHSSFYDVMLGTDPEHFIPPLDCKPGKELKKFPKFKF